MESSNERMIHQWILQHSCKHIWNIFIQPNSYEEPGKEIDAYSNIIDGILQVLQLEDWGLERRETDWLCLTEFCFKCHKLMFGGARNNTDESNIRLFGTNEHNDENSVGLFNSNLIRLFARHGVSNEKVSQVINVFNKTQQIKGMALKSKSLDERVNKADKKLHNDIKVIAREAGVKLGPSFLEQLVSSVFNCATNQINFSDLLKVTDGPMEQSTELKQDQSERKQTIESKTTHIRKGARRLYNPSRTFNLADPLPDSRANASEKSSPAKTPKIATAATTAAATVAAATAATAAASAPLLTCTVTQSSPRLPARNSSTPGKSSGSAKKHSDMQAKTPATNRFAGKDGEGPSSITSAQRDTMACDFTSTAQNRMATRASDNTPHQHSPSTKKRLSNSRYELRSAKKKSKCTTDNGDAVKQDSDSDPNISLRISTDSEAECSSEMNAGKDVVAHLNESEEHCLDSFTDIDNVGESSRERTNSLDSGENAKICDEPNKNMQPDSFIIVSDSEEDNLRFRRRRRFKLPEKLCVSDKDESNAKDGESECDVLSDQENVSEASSLGATRFISTEQSENIDKMNKPCATAENARGTKRHHSSASDDSIADEANLPDFNMKQSRRRFFTLEEEEWLREGVSRFGVGKWKSILAHYPFEGRTSVNLKDKWRNLVNAGLA